MCLPGLYLLELDGMFDNWLELADEQPKGRYRLLEDLREWCAEYLLVLVEDVRFTRIE